MSIAELIARHRTLYDRWIYARNEVWRLHEAFDPDYNLTSQAEIEAAIQATYGAQGDDAALHYKDMVDLADKRALAEDEAWTQLATIPLLSPENVKQWLDYVLEHSRKGDEVVTLRRALEHLGGMLIERLAA